MYRKSMAVHAPVEGGGSEFMTRLSELPLSQMALVQLSTLYNRAREQRLLGLGLKAGEGTLHLAVKVATPIVSMLPVSSIDSMACRQLEKLEEAVPALKKDPKEMIASPGEVVNSTLAPCVSAVKSISYNTVSGVKEFAAETTAPTVERVNKVTAYSKQTIDNVKSGVANTYEGAKGTVAKLCTRDGVKTAVSTGYEAVRGLSYEDLRSGVDSRREGLVAGVRAGVEGMRHEVGSYATETLRPTVSRVTTAKNYTVDKVTETYSGVRDMSTRVVDSVYNSRLLKAVNGTLSGVLGLAEQALDTYLPPEADEKSDDDRTSVMELDPASPEAGSWTRSMVLMSNFRQRLYAAGTRNYKCYSTQASDMANYATKRYTIALDSVHSAYDNSYDYLAASYASSKHRLAGYKERGVTVYASAKQRWTDTRDYTTTAVRTSHDYLSASYDSAKSRVVGTGDYVVVTYRSAVKGTRQSLDYVTDVFAKARQMGSDVRVVVIDTWAVGHTRVSGMYGYMSELAQFVIDEVKTTCIYRNMFPSDSTKIKRISPEDEYIPKEGEDKPLAESSPKTAESERKPAEVMPEPKMQTPTRSMTPSGKSRSSSVRKSKVKTEPPKEETSEPAKAPPMDIA